MGAADLAVPPSLIIHFDHGGQYVSNDYKSLVLEA